MSLLLIIPFVQKQWFNLYSLNLNNISFYSILYYLSGAISPSLICLNSLYSYTYYKFNKNKSYSKTVIKGKYLLFLVSINLIFLSFLIGNYFYINFDFIINLYINGLKLPQPDISNSVFLILLIAISLIFKKTRLLIKKLILLIHRIPDDSISHSASLNSRLLAAFGAGNQSGIIVRNQ